ncbi:cysteine desulfurase family protein [Desulfofustis glycolicus]|uniref:cysteine desulfurase n=1 Tax=Desulfofustis glycolicus DSM 9705 TaxID=1121409 RepID=A0A1M5X4Q7_9BACT|nr:cysteine desulfurase family protein [Desulfofustis glycolicus]MCB2216096.1 cysteine desulfurase [Desulfobulbaceae bacterium]SHH94815.1 cysteine desulfurase [Desulfofustis glycolicus DSM 9705]
MSRPVYLDYNGTTPHAPEVIAAMRPFLESDFGNPSSGHWYGIRPKQAVIAARKQVAGLLGCAPSEVLFTSGGTEANNQVIKSIAGARHTTGRHLITSSIEHPAILEVCRHMERHGFDVTVVEVDSDGLVDPADVAAAIRTDTIMISIMHANNEVGTIQPIAEIATLARRHGILMHTDAAQSLGKIPARVDELGVDLLSMAGHKLYAPKGVGALYIRKTVEPQVFCHGAGQENGRRAGTENVLEIVGLGAACQLAGADLGHHAAHQQAMRDRLEAGLSANLTEIRFNGHRTYRLPNTCSVSFYGLEANRLLEEIGLDVAASAGAACHADRVEISHVLTAMQVTESWAAGTLRFTTGRYTTAEDIDRALAAVVSAVQRLRG